MTEKQAIAEFMRDYFPELFKKELENKMRDIPGRRQEWTFFVDNLVRDGRATNEQVQNWGNPF